MAITDLFASPEPGSGALASGSTSYATAREGGSVTVTEITSWDVGQVLIGANYTCYESFADFSVSGLSGVVDADLGLTVGTDLTDTDFTAEARGFDYGAALAIGDYRPGSTLSGLPLLATLDTSTFTGSGYQTFTPNGTALVDAVLAAIAGSGVLRVIVNSSRHRAGTTPTGQELAVFYSGDTGQPPRLRVVTTDAFWSARIISSD